MLRRRSRSVGLLECGFQAVLVSPKLAAAGLRNMLATENGHWLLEQSLLTGLGNLGFTGSRWK